MALLPLFRHACQLVVQCLWAVVGLTSEFPCLPCSLFSMPALLSKASSSLPVPQGPGFSFPLTCPPSWSGPMVVGSAETSCAAMHRCFSCETFQTENSPGVSRIYLWLCWVFVAVQAFSSCGRRGLFFIAVCGLLIAVASLVADCRAQVQ